MRGAALLVLGLLGALTLAACGAPAVAPPGPPPHVLLVLVEELPWDGPGALGEADLHTPHLNRLLAEGSALTHLYALGHSQGPDVGWSSRARLLSGQHAPQHGESHDGLARRFARAGYRTWTAGDWPDDCADLRDSFAEHVSTSANPDPDQSATDQALEFLQAWADQAAAQPARVAPWLICLSMRGAADPGRAPEAQRQRYPAGRRELPPLGRAVHPFSSGPLAADQFHREGHAGSANALRERLAEHAAAVSHFDAQVGRLLAALDRLELAAATLVVVAPAHGSALGQHGLLGHADLYDHSARLTHIWRGPGVPADVRRPVLGHSHSLTPSLAEWCGLPPGATPGAPSMADLLRSSERPGPATVVALLGDEAYMVRDRRHKLIVYPQALQVQLFDLQADPFELENLAADPDRRSTIQRLRAALLAGLAEVGEPLDPALLADLEDWTVTSLVDE